MRETTPNDVLLSEAYCILFLAPVWSSLSLPCIARIRENERRFTVALEA
jgi:hypothetical protein